MNKRFTDLFINRPVLATVVSLLIFFVGLRAIFDLPVRQFPKMENTQIVITTTYPGASAKLVQGFITSILEKSVATAAGIDYLISNSTNGSSVITAYIKLNFDPNEAFTNIMSKVQQVKSQLPSAAQDPIIKKETGSQFDLLYIGFDSKRMSREQITDYIERVVQPKLETVSGVAKAEILGQKRFAMRIWLNTIKMAALGVTPADVSRALQNNNFQTAAGKTKGKYVQIAITASTDLQSVAGFENLIIKHGRQGQLVHLKDVARVELGSEDYDSSVVFNGEKAVFVGIQSTPTANPLNVITVVKKLLPSIQQQFPPSLNAKVVYDATKYIRASIHEVTRTIIEASLIVIIVIYLFLGSLRTVTIPMVTIPLSLIGVCGLMLGLRYSFNLMTLLAMVLAIGMVVDDAIVVVENIYRHIEEGMKPFDAAIKGAREIAFPVIAMTITLAAVYAPIGFMGGLTGALFKEFAFTLACAVIISGVIALTLSPMMCSRILSAEISRGRFVHFVDVSFEKLKNRYFRLLHGSLNFKPVTVFFAFVVLTSCIFLYVSAPTQLAPAEDQGVVFAVVNAPQAANLNYIEKFTNQFDKIYRSLKSFADYFTVNVAGGSEPSFSGVMLKPWNQRKQTEQQAYAIIKQKFAHVAGVKAMAFPLPSLPTTGSAIPIQFVVTSTMSYSMIYPVVQRLLVAAEKSGLFFFVDSSLKFNKPQIDIHIDRAKAAQLGIKMSEVADDLASSFGGNYINFFALQGQSYKVIPQLDQRFRFNPEQISNIYINTASGKLVPLSTIATINYSIQPNALTRFQQLNSATIVGAMRPGHTLAEGLAFLTNEAKKILPAGMSVNYGGQSRQLVQEGSALMVTFVFSIIVIFLVLAAQFESFRDPLVVMTSVPMAICGALLPLNWGLATINVYTQIGLITLIGLISKHGILMVEFANQLQIQESLSPREAIEKAAAIRLRPVIMTTMAMILGVLPLILSSGAGAGARHAIGLVIACGMTIGTIFTLFVVPTMYLLKARNILLLLLAVFSIGSALYMILF